MRGAPPDLQWEVVSLRLDTAEDCLALSKFYVETRNVLSINFGYHWADDCYDFHAVWATES